MRITVEEWKRLEAKGRRVSAPKKPRKPVAFIGARSIAVNEGIIFELPVRVESLQNLREHWQAEAARKKRERGGTLRRMREMVGSVRLCSTVRAPLVVTLVRLGPRALDYSNMVGGCKHFQDGVADWLEIDDGSPLLEWVYLQEKSKAYGLRVKVERKAAT